MTNEFAPAHTAATSPPTTPAGAAQVVLYALELREPRPTGINRYVRQLIGALSELPDQGIRYRMASSPGDSAGDLPADLPYSAPPGPGKALHVSWAFTRRPTIDRWVGRPDLVHALYTNTTVPTVAPLVYTVHDLLPMRHPEWYSRRVQVAFRRAIAHARTRATALIADSSTVAADIVDVVGFDPERVHVVPLGVAPEFFAPVGDEDLARVLARHQLSAGSYVLAIGSISERKNLRPVIEALPALADLGVRLVVAGPPGEGFDSLRHLVARLGLDPVVRLPGWTSSSDLRALLAGAAALVHPSIFEGFGMTPLEAMAAGVPCVVASGGSLPEVVGDAALSVPPQDGEAWADAIRRLVTDSGLRARLVESGRRRAAGFTWADTARLTSQVHQRYLGGR